MKQKYNVKDAEGRWHVAIADWLPDAKDDALRCVYCGTELMPKACESVEKAPYEELWCRLPNQQPYYGTALKYCNLYGASEQWFWVGRPPLGEPVVVANLEHLTMVPNDRFARLLEYVCELTNRRVEDWHDGDSEGPLHEYLGMSEEEYELYVSKQAYPGEINDLTKVEPLLTEKDDGTEKEGKEPSGSVSGADEGDAEESE